LRLRPSDVAERLGDVARGARVDIADESERDMIVLGLEPARADDDAAHKRELADDAVRQFKRGEQAGHVAPTPAPWR
jgi:hypothetical protein